MTHLSKIPLGKNQGLTVGEVLKKSKIDLIYSYFNYANITYTDDILDELRINPEDRIVKPGKSPDKTHFYIQRNMSLTAHIAAKKVNKESDPKLQEIIAATVYKRKVKSVALAKLEKFRRQDMIRYSKSSLQARNQGRF
jgi:hypothetical protein